MTELKKTADRFSGQPFSPIKLSTATQLKQMRAFFTRFHGVEIHFDAFAELFKQRNKVELVLRETVYERYPTLCD